jgi:hypothetical protein
MNFNSSAPLSSEQINSIVEFLKSQGLKVEIENPVKDFTTEVESVKNQRVSKRLKELETTVSYYETVNAAFEIALNEVLNDNEESRSIVSVLDKCRRNDNFKGMSPVYAKYRGKDLHTENLLRTLAAIYRLKLKPYKSPSGKSSDRATVRKELRCPECGQLSIKLVKFLEIKGIKWGEI